MRRLKAPRLCTFSCSAAWVQVKGPALRELRAGGVADRRLHYAPGLRRKAADLIARGYGRKRLARTLGIPVSTAREWIMCYRSGASLNVTNAQPRYKRFPVAVKRVAVYEHLVRGETFASLMARYGVNDLSTIKKWCRAYGEDVSKNGV